MGIDLEKIRDRRDTAADLAGPAAYVLINTDVPALLDEIERLTRERDEARADVVTLGKKLAGSHDIDTHGSLKAWMDKLKDAEMPSND